MMKISNFAVAGALALIPITASAFETMTQSVCDAGFARFDDMVTAGGDGDIERQHDISVTADGWCQYRSKDPSFEADFLDWRMDGSARWTDQGIPPLGFEVRIGGLDPDTDGVDTGRPDVSVQALLRQDPDAGIVILERAVMDNGAGDVLSVSGVFERVFLSSLSMMQVSMGSVTFKAGLVSLTLDGTHENPFGFHGDIEIRGNKQAQVDAAFRSISALPDGMVDDASRAELLAYAQDLPRPIGTLEVSIASDRGLGLMQIGSSLYSSFVAIMDDGEDMGEGAIAREMELLFDGVRVSADWTPAASITD